jgi:hypothetical protein
MGRYNLTWRYKLTWVLHDACPTAHLGTDSAGFFASGLVLLLQMALNLIWPYCILALLAYDYSILCSMVEILTRNAYN